MPPPAGPDGDDGDDTNRPPWPLVDDDDDDDDDGAAPTFDFPGQNRDSTLVCFNYVLNPALVAPDFVHLTFGCYSSLKLRQIIEAGPNNASKFRNRWRPDTIVNEVLVPLLEQWLILGTWIPEEAVLPLIESIKAALRGNKECEKCIVFNRISDDQQLLPFLNATSFREYLLAPESIRYGHISVGIGLGGKPSRLLLDFLKSHPPPPPNVTSPAALVEAPGTPSASSASRDPPGTATPSPRARSQTSRTPGTPRAASNDSASPPSARTVYHDSDDLGSTAPQPPDSDAFGDHFSEFETANESFDTDAAAPPPKATKPTSILQPPRRSKTTSTRFPNASLPSDDSPPSGDSDPDWESHDREGFQYPRTPGPDYYREIRQDDIILRGYDWAAFTFNVHEGIKMLPDGSFPPWTGDRPLHPHHHKHYAVKLPSFLQDKNFFLSFFGPNTFAVESLQKKFTTCRETMPTWDGDRETLPFYVLQLVHHMQAFNFFLPPPHTVTTRNHKGSWWESLSIIYRRSEQLLSSHFRQCLTSKNAGLINDQYFKSLFMNVSNGFQCYASLLQAIRTPSLALSPRPCFRAIDQDNNTTVCTYVNRHVAETVLMSQRGIMYSERYFYFLLWTGLYTANDEGKALRASLKEFINSQDLNSPLGAEYALDNLHTLLTICLQANGHEYYLTLTPRQADARREAAARREADARRQTQRRDSSQQPAVPTPSAPYAPRSPGNALPPRPSNFAAQPPRQTSFKPPAKPVHALAATEAGEGYEADAYAEDAPHDEVDPPLDHEASLENPTDKGPDFR